MVVVYNFNKTSNSNLAADASFGYEKFDPGDGMHAHSPRDYETVCERRGTYLQECAKMAPHVVKYCYYSWKHGYPMEQALRCVHQNCSVAMPAVAILYHDEIDNFRKLQQTICALVYELANAGKSELDTFAIIWNVHCDMVAAHNENINAAAENENFDLTELEWQEPSFDAQQPIVVPEGEELRDAYDVDEWTDFTKWHDEEQQRVKEYWEERDRKINREFKWNTFAMCIFLLFALVVSPELMPAVTNMAHSASDLRATTNDYLSAKMGPAVAGVQQVAASISATFETFAQGFASIADDTSNETEPVAETKTYECVPPSGVFANQLAFRKRRYEHYDCRLRNECPSDVSPEYGACHHQIFDEVFNKKLKLPKHFPMELPKHFPASAPPSHFSTPEDAHSILDPFKSLARTFQIKVQGAVERATEFYQELKSMASDFVSRIVDSFTTLARTLQTKACEAVARAMKVCQELTSMAATKAQQAVARAMKVCQELTSMAVTKAQQVAAGTVQVYQELTSMATTKAQQAVASTVQVYQELKSTAAAAIPDFSLIAHKSTAFFKKVRESLDSQTEPIPTPSALPAFNAFDTIAFIERFMTPSQFDEDRGVAFFHLLEKLRPAEEEQHCCRREDLLCRFNAMVADYVPKFAPYLQLPEHGDGHVKPFDALDFVIQHDKTYFQPSEFPEPDVPLSVQLRLLSHQYVADFRDAVASSLHRLAHWISTNEPTPLPSHDPPLIKNQDGDEIPAPKNTRVCVSDDSFWDVASETLQLAEAYAHEAFQARIASPNNKLISAAAVGSKKKHKPNRPATANTNTEDLQDQSDSALRPSYKFSRSRLSSLSPTQINVAHQLKPDQNCE